MLIANDEYTKGPLGERLDRSRRHEPMMFWSMIALSMLALATIASATYLTITTPSTASLSEPLP